MQKKILLFVISILCCSSIILAQHSGAKHGITFKYLATDYYSPKVWSGYIDTDYNFSDAIDKRGGGVEVGYFRHLNEFINIGVPLRIGTLDSLGATPELNATNLNKKRTFVNLDLVAQFKYFKPTTFFNPYLFAGVGGMLLQDDDLDIQFPAGIGFNLKLSRNFYLQLQTEYRFSLSDNRNNLHGTAGLLFLIHNDGGVKKKEPKVVVEPTDIDGDGVTDDIDQCPRDKGLAKFNGCPDSDNDGIINSKDDCPNIAGIAANNGCPEEEEEEEEVKIVDTDGDGVDDKNDRCPRTAGLARFNGCPDTDGDGVADADDKCPTTAGVASNSGCPELKEEDKATLEEARYAVEFETAKSTIRSTSHGILDKIVDIMTRYKDYNLSIGGHTDSVGSSESNQQLSERRAKACYDYIVAKGINPNRISYTGFGETRPIADNKYKDGRQANRRVEFDLYLK